MSNVSHDLISTTGCYAPGCDHISKDLCGWEPGAQHPLLPDRDESLHLWRHDTVSHAPHLDGSIALNLNRIK